MACGRASERRTKAEGRFDGKAVEECCVQLITNYLGVSCPSNGNAIASCSHSGGQLDDTALGSVKHWHLVLRL